MIPDHSDGLDAHSPRSRRGPLPLRCGQEHPEVAARADSISIGRAPGAVFCVDVLPRIRRKTARNFKFISLHAAYTKLMREPAIAVGPLALGPLAPEPMRVEVVGRTWMFCSRSAAMMLFICRS